jgi:dihydrofolate reductase
MDAIDTGVPLGVVWPRKLVLLSPVSSGLNVVPFGANRMAVSLRSLAPRESTMSTSKSRVTIHMAASVDGFVARTDGSVDWLETSDDYSGGETLDARVVEAFLKTIDCYVMGSRTYETALAFEAKGLGWPYGDKPTFVLTHRVLSRVRDSVEFCAGDLAELVNGRLRTAFGTIWIAGGGQVAAECLRRGLADEIRYSILPILIGDGIRFFGTLEEDVALHLAEAKVYRSGMVDLCYQVNNCLER